MAQALGALDDEPSDALGAQHDAWCADVVDRAEQARVCGRPTSEDELGVDHVTRPVPAAQPVPRFRPMAWPPSHPDARYERLPDPAPPPAPRPATPFLDEPAF